jgi:DNA-binding MarR family transcriptional regulator
LNSQLIIKVITMINQSLDICLQLHRVQSVLARRFSFHGLGFSDFVVLYQLHAAPSGRLRRVDLADQLGITASAVTRILLPLEKIGLIAREPDTRDARVAYASITPAGQQLLQDAMVTAERISEEIIPVDQAGSILQALAVFKRL